VHLNNPAPLHFKPKIMKCFRWGCLGLMLSVGLFAGCGGGGGESAAVTNPPAITPPLTSVTMPKISYAVQDFRVFSSTRDYIIPSRLGVTSSVVSGYIDAVSPDGSHSRTNTKSTAIGSTLASSYDSNRRVLQVSGKNPDQSGYTCTYSSPGLPTSILPGEGVGASFKYSGYLNCKSSDSAVVTAVVTSSGRAEALETLSLSVGQFSTIRSSRTQVHEYPNRTETINMTEWVDLNSGSTLKTTLGVIIVPTGAATPSSVYSQEDTLTAFSFASAGSAGATVQRFAGFWQLDLSGAGLESTSCADVLIDTNGLLTSTSCELKAVVDDSGKITVNTPASLSFGGAITKPYSGNGTLTDSATGVQGIWMINRR
jgi:hypothetical protein